MESIGTYPYLSYLDSAVDAPLGTVVILNDPSLSLFTDEEIARMTTQFRALEVTPMSPSPISELLR